MKGLLGRRVSARLAGLSRAPALPRARKQACRQGTVVVIRASVMVYWFAKKVSVGLFSNGGMVARNPVNGATCSGVAQNGGPR